MSAEPQLQQFLHDVTDAVLAGESMDAARAMTDLPLDESQEWLDLIVQLNSTLVRVEPDTRFASTLKDELLGQPQTGFVWQIRRLPARVQVAAIAAIAGGFLLLLQRLFVGEGSTSHEDSGAFHASDMDA